jgi:hypothetical protein
LLLFATTVHISYAAEQGSSQPVRDVRDLGLAFVEVEDFQKTMEKATPDKGVLFLVDRGGSTFFITLREEG